MTSDDASADADAGAPGVPCTCQAIRQAARRVTALYDAAMAPFGLRISQFSLLSRLRRAGPMGLQALAAEMGLDRTTLGRNLRPLERDGLVCSADDRGDRRVRLLALTDAGQARLLAAMPAWHGVQAAFEAGYGSVDAAALRRSLALVTERLGPAA